MLHSPPIVHQLPRVGAPHSGHTCHLHRLPRSPHRADPGRCPLPPLPHVANSSCIVWFPSNQVGHRPPASAVFRGSKRHMRVASHHFRHLPCHSSRAHPAVPLPQVWKHRMPGIPGLPDEGEAVVEPSALQASPQADAAAAVMQFSAAAAAAVAAAPYVTSKMEVDAAAAGRPIPKLRCPTCGVTREVELIQQQTGAPKIRYISGPTYVSTGRKGVQKCGCKKCGFFSLNPPGFFSLNPPRDDDAAATTAASASAVAAAAAAPAVTAAPPAATATSAAASASLEKWRRCL